MPFDQVNFVLPAVETDGVLRVIARAMEMLTPTTWVKNAGCGRESFCIVVAISHACDDLGYEFDIDLAARRALRPHTPEQYRHAALFVFNDAPATTLADIHALGDRAIAARRGELS